MNLKHKSTSSLVAPRANALPFGGQLAEDISFLQMQFISRLTALTIALRISVECTCSHRSTPESIGRSMISWGGVVWGRSMRWQATGGY